MLILNAKVYDENFDLRDLDLRVENGKIAEIAERGALKFDNEEVLDLEGKILAPGMIDIHVHGAMGRDTMDASEDSLDVISRYLASKGITSFLPTTMTMDYDHLAPVFKIGPELSGAEMLGFHMEGPFINKAKKGAQNEAYVRNATLEEMESYTPALPIRVITVAPETEGAVDFIKEYSKHAVVSLGHTMANYDEASAAIEAGAKSITHCFNAMPQLEGRNPNVIGAAAEAGINAEAICDGIHLHPATVQAIYKMFGLTRMTLISDALSSAGLGDGEYELGGQKYFMVDGVCRVESGAIAGSTSNVWRNARNCTEWNIPVKDALRMGSLTPAELIGVADRKGSIAVGKDADFVVTNEALEVLDVYLNGKRFVA